MAAAIKKLALKMFAITPYQTTCEWVFSILNWMIGKRRTRFSSNNINVNELKTAIQEVVTAMINNDDIFVEEEEDDEVGEHHDIFSDDDDINLDEVDMNNLLLAGAINLNIPEFKERNKDDDINGIQL
ncbi:hypothetical protein C1645_738795 [Glomus cerebriforme]|uniref:HAT C-terminal dimerisation domain-containing protein n=1 Tax=Glomus cerebriforme TaxID=658196 RepID=A0A397SX53_9GLOM|nr:hypothetical protein C1645_738795 [Glomus cerebriforme]